jgi:hypothetical protein
MQRRLYILGFMFLVGEVAIGASATEVRTEGAYVRFQGDNRFDDMYALSAIASGEFWGDPGQGHLTQIQASATFIKSGAPALYSSPSEIISLERRASVGVVQTISQLSSFGVNFGFTSQSTSDSKNSLSRWYAARVGHWWNKATLLTEFEAMRNDSSLPVRSYLDTDSRRVLTPDRVQGSRYSLNLTWLATPQAMLLGAVSKIITDNRPDAISASFEGRYFVNATATAIHLKTAAYEDSSEVGRNTDYGKISAKEFEIQMHQHVTDQIIFAVVSRDHLEQEDPRSLESDLLSRHSKMLQGRLRYRFVSGPVTDTVPELYFFLGQYNSLDSGAKINHAGLGGTYVL